MLKLSLGKSLRLLSFVCFVSFICLLVCCGASSAFAQTRGTDVTQAAAGNILLSVKGTFSTDDVTAVLERVNQIRLEACSDGVVDPRDTSRKLTTSDYVPIKWSSNLEEIAQTRAAEASINQQHPRPNGKSCFDAYKTSYSNIAENLAWNDTGMLSGIEQFYGEKAGWVNQDSNVVTGHYTSMINPSLNYTGLGAFVPASGGWVCTAMEFCASSSNLDQSKVGVVGLYDQIIEFQKSNVTALSLSGSGSLICGASKACSLTATVKTVSLATESGYATVDATAVDTGALSSSNTSIISFGAGTTLKAVGVGAARVTCSCGTQSASITLTVVPATTSVKKVAPKKKAIVVTWQKQAQQTGGYQIRYSKKASMASSKNVTVSGSTKTSYTVKKLSSKTKYYVQVRTYKKVGGKYYYSAWSSAKKATTK